MKSNSPISYPPLWHRLFSVWYRHVRVYAQHLFSNAFPPFFEPLIFLAGVGLGLGRYIDPIDGRPYVQFLAIGLLITSSMWTAFFECTFGTFIRMEFQKTYDGMLSAPITANNLIVGEMLWAASKGFFFSFAVLCMLTLVSLVWPTAMPMLPMPNALIAPLVGFCNALMFGAMALLITSFVKTINNNYALEARGVWELENDFMGGPFISYLIHNPQKGELLFIDGFVYSPGERKREYMQHLEHIISSVEF